MNRIIDRNFGINYQAMAVLSYLEGMEPDFADYENGYKVNFKTVPWYNGRESGFCVSMQEQLYKGNWIHIAVFEHRNSDSICALVWETKTSYWNHPLEDENIFDAAYKGTSKYDVAFSVSPGEIGAMADFVYAQLSKFYKSSKAEGEAHNG